MAARIGRLLTDGDSDGTPALRRTAAPDARREVREVGKGLGRVSGLGPKARG